MAKGKGNEKTYCGFGMMIGWSSGVLRLSQDCFTIIEAVSYGMVGEPKENHLLTASELTKDLSQDLDEMKRSE